jgi:hypothetical protein
MGIGTLTPGSTLDVAGDINFIGSVRFQGNPVLQVPGGLSSSNIALGLGAMQNVITGTTSNGPGCGMHVSTLPCGPSNNTASGTQALQGNTTGSFNTASGAFAPRQNAGGSFNSASGSNSMTQNTSGIFNTAVGYNALGANTTGARNIAIGVSSAVNVLGSNSDNIHVGNTGFSADDHTIRIGQVQTSFFVAGVNGVTTTNSAVPVLIDTTNGQLGVTSSSRRYKEDIEDMGAASHDLMRLRPVIYRYKKPFADGSKPIQYGLIAEEVAEVYPDLVAHSADGQIETVKYQVLDSMLLNEVQRQEAEIRRLEQQSKSLQERLAKLETALAAISGESRVPSGH